jgi:hypothetical protein
MFLSDRFPSVLLYGISGRTIVLEPITEFYRDDKDNQFD